MSHIICDLVNSTQRNPKIIVHGYLLVKDKYRENEEHVLVKSTDHNHAPEASRVDVVKTLNEIKDTAASQTRVKPAQIIQDSIVNMPQASYSYMPNKEALRRQISRVRADNMPPQPQTLQDIDVPINLRVTINGEQFLTRDITFDEEKIMIFCPASNLEYLQKANYWIMDGTFKMVPTLFQQMYTIHALVGGNNNSRVLPMVYALMTSKSKESYERLFQGLIEFGEENDQILIPPVIISDFEQASINAVQVEFPDSIQKGCFFHLCQNFWKKIQALGLAAEYGESENFSIMLRHITALSFLPPSEIPSAFDQIKPLMPLNAIELVQYFEDNYVHGKIIRCRQLRNNQTVTRNHHNFHLSSEGWHQRWGSLIGRAHVGVYSIIDEMRKEQHQTELQVESIIRGEERPHQRKHYVDRENRLLNIYNNRNDYSLLDFLRGIAHNISF
ncbi:unnamed protein product [Rhizophagus irregularis]|uniref:MULE transposase domain-containing protein n=1 Tax=Rhizophagus irregularis TaxID=588596 RepID=A0A916DY81_9GLOM|nr:unnamed protein product [Rhizophagus irregularis]CAB5320655.1 unnamed protein product [Rhizophagus irregularis]